MVDQDISDWLASKPGPFKATNLLDAWCKAFADFSGKDIDGFDMGFLSAVESAGHTLKPMTTSYVLEAKP